MMLWVHFRHSQEGTTLAGDFLLCVTLGMAPCSAPDPEDAAPTTLKECEPTGALSPPSHPFTGKESQPGSPRKHPDLTKNELASSSHKCPGRSCQSQSLSLHCGSVPSAAVSAPGPLRWQKIPAGDTKVLAGHWSHSQTQQLSQTHTSSALAPSGAAAPQHP